MRFGRKRNAALLSLFLVWALLASACGQKNASTVGGEADAAGNADKPLAGKRVALIMEFNTGTFSQQYVQGVTEEVEKFGGKLTKFVAGNDKAKMASLLDSAITQRFDLILTDHGDQLLQPGVQKAVSQKIPVVVFDADVHVAGATTLSQDDRKMAELTLEQMKKDIGGKGNIVKVWVAGFAPMERRQTAYSKFMQENPDIKEIATFGTAQNPALDTQTQMEAILKQYPKGQISAVWTAWDEFAKGAARAIQQAGRDEIKVYGIDMSDEDLQMIQDPKNPWVASAAVDPKDIGRIQVRYGYQKLHGDKTEDEVVLEPVYVSRDALPQEQISTTELSKYVKGWGESKQGLADWMAEYGK
ncbi:sugar ABC transporter substrate-binding protein [Paenibacillus sp. JTLBN-2024]|uniref:sugar ABC transporter substrate-binding protein n=1 Tax=Paenibacillus sp. FSL M7-1455 TaxID=2975316 RepID=UPI0030F4F259